MIRHTLQNINKLIKEKKYALPEIMYKLASFLMQFAKKLEQKGSQYAALDLYADALKLFRRYLVDEPFKLTKITTPSINQALNSDSFQHLAEILDLRNRFLKQLAAFSPSDPFGKKAVSELNDMKWAKKMEGPLKAAQSLKNQMEQKKGICSWMSEMSVLLWYGELKGEFILQIDLFLEKCVVFFKQFFPIVDFINENTFPYLKQLCDPDKKYFISACNCDDLFQRLREPEVISKLWQLSQQKIKNEQPVSESSMVVRLTTADQTIDQIIGITGQKIILSQGSERDVKLPPAILFGSASNSDIVLKSKYISRKQMAIIQDRKQDKGSNADLNKYNFSIICLSQANFTIVNYPHRVKASVGLIFFGNEVKYQILHCDKIQPILSQNQNEDDRTLTILPPEKIAMSSKSAQMIEQLTFLILSGEDKEKEISFSTNTFASITEGQNKHLAILKDFFQFDEEFYLKSGVKILCKTSNQIIEGRPSHKIRLCKDMKILIEEYTITID